MKVDHQQLFTYLKLKELKHGYLLSCGAPLMKESLKRMINALEDKNLGVFGSWREFLFRWKHKYQRLLVIQENSYTSPIPVSLKLKGLGKSL